MSHLGPVVIVSSGESPALAGQLAKSGAFPIVDADWDGAVAAIKDVQPAAVIANMASAAPAIAPLAAACRKAFAYTPLIAVGAVDSTADWPHEAMPFTTSELGLERLDGRVAAALRVRALHGAVLRRMAEAPTDVSMPSDDPLQ